MTKNNLQELKTAYNNLSGDKFQLWKSAFKTSISDCKLINSEMLMVLLIKNSENPYYIKMHEHYEAYIMNGDEKEKKNYEKMKEELEYLTMPILVYPKRNKENIRVFNHLVILDFDAKDNQILIENFDSIKEKLRNDSLTHMVFNSPNNHGLKVVVRIASPTIVYDIIDGIRNNLYSIEDKEYNIQKLNKYYKYAYFDISKYLMINYDIKADTNACSILGGTYLSADIDPYYNPNSSYYDLSYINLKTKTQTTVQIKTNSVTYQTSNYEILGEIEMYVEKYCDSRHNKTMRITLQATYYGIPENEIVDYCYSSFGAVDHTLDEIKRTVRDFYEKPYLGNQFIIRELYLKSC